MANDKNFKIKNGLLAGRYLQSAGAETAGSEAYDLAGASYDSVSKDVGSQDTSIRNLMFNNDGTKMYVAGTTNDRIYQYSLSTPFDLSTASYDSVNFSVSGQDTTPRGLAFNDDGTKMYMVGGSSGALYQYSLSTAYDLSTASYNSVSLDVSGQDSSLFAIAFNGDGTKMYISGSGNDSVYQYSLSTAYDLSTASYDSISLDVSGQDTAPYAMAFNNDGTKLYVGGVSSDSVHQYSLSTAFDLSTASYDSVSFDVSGQVNTLVGLAFNNDGTKMFLSSLNAGNFIYQYSTVAYTQALDLSTGSYFQFTPSGAATVSFTNAPASGKAIGFSVEINGDGSAITWPSSVKWDSGVAPTATASKELYAFVTADGGTTYYGRKAVEDLA